jgi:hypothetical protein
LGIIEGYTYMVTQKHLSRPTGDAVARNRAFLHLGIWGRKEVGLLVTILVREYLA